MTLYETIFKRRSVRKYDMTPLSQNILDDIKKFIDNTKQLPEQAARFEIVSSSEVNGTSAPHYILSFCETDDLAYANVGYVLEKADLYIQSLGLGSVWLGMAKPRQSRDGFCILLAFGKSEMPFRESEKDFNRLSLNEISNSDNKIAQAARLAPSAVNSQPWKLNFEENSVTVNYFGRGLMKIMLKSKMNKVDVGIITRHIVTTLENEGKELISVIPEIVDKALTVKVTYK